MASFHSRSLTQRKDNCLEFEETTISMQKGGDSITYACEDCGFLFYRAGEVKRCPSCEKKHIRSATGEETQRLQILLERGKPTLREEEE